ncbi:hypothetical protein ACFLWY_05675, partial [Chloroflexota bacterium]
RFHLAVVEAQSAFESFFYSFVNHELVRRGMMTPALQEELTKPGLRNEIKRSIAGKKGMTKLEYFSFLVTTPPRYFTKGMPEYDNWYHKTYSLRNQVVHQGRTNVTQKEAEEAFQAANDAFSFFGQNWRNLTF